MSDEKAVGRRYRLGVDIGGTFTDAALIDEATGEVRICKVPSTPQDPSEGFLAAVERSLREAGVSPQEVSYLVHGTTVATNAIIEGKTARTGFVTTQGFRDMLEIGRQTRPALYDLLFEKPAPLVPRYLAMEVRERLDARGRVVTPLDEADVRRVAERLRREGVEAVAVCFLHSYIDGRHERRAGEILAELLPGAAVSISSDLVPEFREYLRASTTVVNAAVRPVVERYLRSIEERLRGSGLEAELLVMQSSGGVYSFGAARERPVFMVESGPAAGVVAATYVGRNIGVEDVITFDMGGTTAKVGLVLEGRPGVTKEYEVGATARPGAGSGRGQGYPIRTPVIDLVEIGAGGGSIAWVDPGGALRVGPRSAGADPGPACYGQGGREPTVTDANLLLGRLNPRFFLGGEIHLDPEAARRAIEERCARPLGMDVIQAARGIVEIANSAMVNAMRLVSLQRGHDPRDFALVAFGGAGPLHAGRLAAEMGVRLTVIPPNPGITSATGLLVTDLRHEYIATLLRRADDLPSHQVEEAFRRLEEEGRQAMAREGLSPDAMSFLRQAEMRYVGQSYELTVPVDRGDVEEAIPRAVERFHREHLRAYGFHSPQEPVELVNLRLVAVGRIRRPQPRRLPPGEAVDGARKGHRPVFFEEAGDFVPCPIYDRYGLGAGATLEGPAVVEEPDSTTLIPPGWQARVDRLGNLLIVASPP